MKFLYKYPQAEYPYEQLIVENQHRSREVSEFEIMDTDVFDEDRYWDVFVEVREQQDMQKSPPELTILPVLRNNSTPRTKKTLTASPSVSPRTTEVRNPPISTF